MTSSEADARRAVGGAWRLSGIELSIRAGGSYSGDFTKSFCEAVWEFVAPDEGLECVAGVLEVGALSVADLKLLFFQLLIYY